MSLTQHQIDNIVLTIVNTRECYALFRKRANSGNSIKVSWIASAYGYFRQSTAYIIPALCDSDLELVTKALYDHYQEEFRLPSLKLESTPQQPTTNQEEIPMATTTKTIEVKTYVRGTDLNSLTDAQLYDVIADLENQAEKLGAIKTKPAKLTAKIEELKAEAKAIAALVDAR